MLSAASLDLVAGPDTTATYEKTTDGPLAVGAVINRRSTRFETPTEGTMEVTEFEPANPRPDRRFL